MGNTPAQPQELESCNVKHRTSSASSADSWSVLSPTRVQIDVDPRRVSDGSTFSFMGEETSKLQLDLNLGNGLRLESIWNAKQKKVW